MPGPEDDEPVGFELSEEDLEAIAQAASEVLPDEPSSAETPYTIRNAPVAKSIMPADAFIDLVPPPALEGDAGDDEG